MRCTGPIVLVLSLQQIVDDAFEAMAPFPASLLRAPTG